MTITGFYRVARSPGAAEYEALDFDSYKQAKAVAKGMSDETTTYRVYRVIVEEIETEEVE